MVIVLLIVALIVAAMVLIVIEVLTPTFGILGAVATALLAVSVWQAFVLHAAFGWALLLAVVILVPVYVYVMIKWLPGSALGRKVFLQSAPDGSGEGAPESDRLQSLVGKAGVAETQLRPSGAARIDGQRIVALAESGIIRKGAAITVIKAEASNVIVREVAS